jgi:hypothetical protein
MTAKEQRDWKPIVERVLQMAKSGEAKSLIDAANQLNVHPSTLKEVLRRRAGIRSMPELFSNSRFRKEAEIENETTEAEYGENYINIICASKRIRTVDEAIKEFDIDLNVWKVDRFKVKTSEGYRKDRRVQWEVEGGVTTRGKVDDSGKMLVVPMYHVQVTLVRKVDEIRGRLWLADFIADAKKHAPRYPTLKYKKSKGLIYEVDLPDIHFGKLTWGEESGDDYDIKIAREIVLKTLDRLLSYAHPFGVDRIILPMGNDFFNVDNKDNTTTHGTPQQEDTRWQKTFREGRRLAVDMIDMCQSLAPVDVLIVPGNHDEQRSFYLGEVLDAQYSKHKHVQVDNSPMKRKYRHYGNILLGFTHGYHEKLKQLPSLMPVEKPEEWARSKFREWHLGDKHHKKDLLHRTEDVDGVTIRLLRSLSATDVWHFDKGYVGAPRSAEAFLWDVSDGLVAQFQAGLK